jgi:hypothetical protein
MEGKQGSGACVACSRGDKVVKEGGSEAGSPSSCMPWARRRSGARVLFWVLYEPGSRRGIRSERGRLWGLIPKGNGKGERGKREQAQPGKKNRPMVRGGRGRAAEDRWPVARWEKKEKKEKGRK